MADETPEQDDADDSAGSPEPDDEPTVASDVLPDAPAPSDDADATAVLPATDATGDDAPPPPPPPPAAGDDAPSSDPPVPATAPGTGAAGRYVGLGVGALAVGAALLVGYGVGNTTADDDSEPAGFEDGPGEPYDDDNDGDGRGERHRVPGGDRDEDDEDWDDERRGPRIPDLGDLPQGSPRLPGGGDGEFPEGLPDDLDIGFPVFGTVSEVGDDSFVVETPDGESITVTVSDETDFMQIADDGEDDDASLSDLAEQDEVAVLTSDDSEDDDTVEAEDVIFGDVLRVSGPGSRQG